MTNDEPLSWIWVRSAVFPISRPKAIRRVPAAQPDTRVVIAQELARPFPDHRSLEPLRQPHPDLLDLGIGQQAQLVHGFTSTGPEPTPGLGRARSGAGLGIPLRLPVTEQADNLAAGKHFRTGCCPLERPVIEAPQGAESLRGRASPFGVPSAALRLARLLVASTPSSRRT